MAVRWSTFFFPPFLGDLCNDSGPLSILLCLFCFSSSSYGSRLILARRKERHILKLSIIISISIDGWVGGCI